MISDQTHDGIRELEFDAVCYVRRIPSAASAIT